METNKKEAVISEDEETSSQDEVINEKDNDTVEEVEIIDEEVEDELTVDELKEKRISLEKENKEIADRLLRIQAEYENFKRRTAKEKSAERKYKSQDLATELLPVIDNFERALQVDVTDENKGIIDGITMVYNQLEEAFKSQGIEQIKTTHEQFDPNLHHAVMQVEDEEFESNIIIEELQKGFILHDRVIRPAMVKVNK